MLFRPSIALLFFTALSAAAPQNTIGDTDEVIRKIHQSMKESNVNSFYALLHPDYKLILSKPAAKTLLSAIREEFGEPIKINNIESQVDESDPNIFRAAVYSTFTKIDSLELLTFKREGNRIFLLKHYIVKVARAPLPAK